MSSVHQKIDVLKSHLVTAVAYQIVGRRSYNTTIRRQASKHLKGRLGPSVRNVSPLVRNSILVNRLALTCFCMDNQFETKTDHSSYVPENLYELILNTGSFVDSPLLCTRGYHSGGGWGLRGYLNLVHFVKFLIQDGQWSLYLQSGHHPQQFVCCIVAKNGPKTAQSSPNWPKMLKNGDLKVPLVQNCENSVDRRWNQLGEVQANIFGPIGSCRVPPNLAQGCPKWPKLAKHA